MRPDSHTTTADAVDHLQRLASQLEAHAFQVCLTARTGLFPRLHVINPMVPAMTEDVLASSRGRRRMVVLALLGGPHRPCRGCRHRRGTYR